MRRRAPTIALVLLAAATASAQVTIPPDWIEALGNGTAHLGSSDRSGPSLSRGQSTLDLRGDCRAAIRAARQHAPERRVESEGHPLRIRLGEIRSGDRVVYAAEEALCAGGHTEENDFLEQTVYLVSAVGPWVTLSIFISEAGGGGPPYHRQEWLTLDARTGRSASLTDVFEEAELVRALRGVVLGNEQPDADEDPDPRLAGARSFEEARAILREHHWDGAFGFRSYDARRDRAAVSLAIVGEVCGLCPNEAGFVHLTARPRPEARAAFVAASQGRGHLRRAGRIRVD